MKILLLVVVVFFIALAFVVVSKAKKRGSINEAPWPFYARKPLSTPEQVLYFRLCKALPEHIVLAQVGLSRILGVNKGQQLQ